MVHVVTMRPNHFESFGWSKFASIEESKEHCNPLEFLPFDSETTGLGFKFSELLCAQIGDESDQFVIDTKTIDLKTHYKKLLESKQLITHNGIFDLVFLYDKGIIDVNLWDTFLGEYLLSAGINTHKRGLDDCLKRYLNISMSKDTRDDIILNGIDSCEAIEYSGKDVKYLIPLKSKMESKIKQFDVHRAHTLENKFARVLAYMEFCGIHLDRDKWYAKCRRDEYLEYKAWLDLKEEAETMYPEVLHNFLETTKQDEINWSSNKQVTEIFDAIGIDTLNPKTNKKTVDKKVIEKQQAKWDIITKYIDFKEKEKVVTTYGRSWFEFIQDNKRIHSKFKPMVASGRTSGGNVRKGPFPNLQNVPSDNITRHCFTGQGPNVLVVCDYSGQESVILADLSKEPNLIDFYEKGLGDMHSYAASLIWPEYSYEFIVTAKKEKEKGNPLSDKQRKALELRQNAKSANFAIAYGGTGYTLAHNLNISSAEGDKIYKAYLRAFPGLAEYFKYQKASTIERGYILVDKVTGRKRFFNNFNDWKKLEKNNNFWKLAYRVKKTDPERYELEYKEIVDKHRKFKGLMEREALNTPCQGTGASMSKLAGVYFFDWILKNKRFGKVKIVNFVHDEWVIECHQRVAEKTAIILQKCMEKAAEQFLERLTMKAKPEITKVWTH